MDRGWGLAPHTIYFRVSSKGARGAEKPFCRALKTCARDKVQRIMAPFILRRLKSEVLVQLTPKTEKVEELPMVELLAHLAHQY